jgi:hypothetical protein
MIVVDRDKFGKVRWQQPPAGVHGMKFRFGMTAIAAVAMLAGAQAFAQQASTPAPPAAAPAMPAATTTVPATTLPHIASVSETNGRAMLNRASLYEVAKKGQPLQDGDRLVVLESGVVKIQFDTGCTVTIDSPQVYTVEADKPCAPGVAERGLRTEAPASGAGAAGSNQYLKWGLVALGIATPLLLLADSNQGSPISP